MDERTRQFYSAYVGDLRDTADQDYMVARISARLMLPQAAAWSGLQAIEKYFKAILLYNDHGIKKFKTHNLRALLAALEQLPVIGFSLPKESKEFLEYLNSQGPN